MKILDCENDNTMFGSIKVITGIQKKDLIDMFNRFDLDDYYEDNTWIDADALFLKK
ncbi:hypothetical protein FJQ98_19335 [Lysinibacillus agricola]|uniref:Uncharacterized protein n=3 Tax=Lysinibacillus TaxID=400634 RepID=A0ABX7AP81_9BACI|nr:hypothetical protein [Lysinibacillus agricola]QQP11347.1 hypothetical protein FJQ98_19335 [Lysinibacillus agricola]